MIDKKLREKIKNEIKRVESLNKDDYYTGYIHAFKNVLIWDNTLSKNRSTRINKKGERVRKLSSK